MQHWFVFKIFVNLAYILAPFLFFCFFYFLSFWGRRHCSFLLTFIANERQRFLAVPLHPDSQGEYGHTGSVQCDRGFSAGAPVLKGEWIPIGPAGPGVVLLLKADPGGVGHFVSDGHAVVGAHRHQIFETALTDRQTESWWLSHICLYSLIGRGVKDFRLSTWQWLLACSQVRGVLIRKSSCSAELQISIRAAGISGTNQLEHDTQLVPNTIFLTYYMFQKWKS